MLELHESGCLSGVNCTAVFLVVFRRRSQVSARRLHTRLTVTEIRSHVLDSSPAQSADDTAGRKTDEGWRLWPTAAVLSLNDRTTRRVEPATHVANSFSRCLYHASASRWRAKITNSSVSRRRRVCFLLLCHTVLPVYLQSCLACPSLR